MRIKDGKPDQRLKMFFVPREFFIMIFQALAGPEFITLPIMDELPEGAELVGVHEVWDRDCFALVVSHPTYEIVPHGALIPTGQDPFIPLQWFRRKPVGECYEVLPRPGV